MSPRRVVVVGYGMAGARLADAIRRHDPTGQAVRLTVLGAEPHAAYNRVLLSAVLAGSLGPDAVRLHEPGWAGRHRVELRLGGAAVAVHPDRGQVTAIGADGRRERVDYDELVLATGSTPWFPPIAGLTTSGALAEGAVAFRTLDDCRAIVAGAAGGGPVVVLGGGVLGLEAARGLALRGSRVTVVHPVGHLMERMIDPFAGRLLAERLRAGGIEVLLDTSVARYLPGVGLELAPGSGTSGVLEAAMLVVATGVRPVTALATGAGLAVRAGVVVDDQLRTSDPRIRAIGDCAEHPAASVGLVDPAWAQAEVLAELLTGANPAARYRGTRDVVRLKAGGIELTALGESLLDPADPDAEVLCLQDPGGGRYCKVVLRENRVSGAIVLGMPDTAATVTRFYDSGSPAPSDRVALLLGRALPGAAGTNPAADPAVLPPTTLVCRCNSVTKAALVRAWRHAECGVSGFDALVAGTDATTGCGSCRNTVLDIAGWLEDNPPAEDRTTHPIPRDRALPR